jgi:hypothetical protein
MDLLFASTKLQKQLSRQRDMQRAFGEDTHG